MASNRNNHGRLSTCRSPAVRQSESSAASDRTTRLRTIGETMTAYSTGIAELVRSRRGECEHQIRDLAGSGPAQAKKVQDLRRQFGHELTTLLLSVTALQTNAAKKLGETSHGVWWVTDTSLQQATPWQVARLKSTWFGGLAVHDLCCGIGGDAVSLARRGPLVAVDRDPLILAMAEANLAAAEVRDVRMLCDDAARVQINAGSGVHIDPDRRVRGNRKSNPDFYQPTWAEVRSIIQDASSAVVKLAPAAEFSSKERSELEESHRCWISLSGQVREQTLLVGDAITAAKLNPGLLSAVAVDADGSANWFAPTRELQPPTPSDQASQPLSILVDPDPSIRAAGLTDSFARCAGLRVLGGPSGYLTGEDDDGLAMATVGRVIWSGPCDDRHLRRELRSRGFFPRVIKVRGTDHDPAVLAKRYRKCGDEPITLWMGRCGQRAFAAFTK